MKLRLKIDAERLAARVPQVVEEVERHEGEARIGAAVHAIARLLEEVVTLEQESPTA